MTAPLPKPAQIPRIVVADADGDTRELYHEALRSMAVEVVAVADGRDALVQCLLERPALVITNTWLPSIDGYALCELLRRDPLTATVPIIVTTAEAGPSELLRLRRCGGVAVMAAPVAVERIVAMVEGVRDGAESELLPAPVEDPGPHRSPYMSTASKRFRRFVTTTPPTAAPALHCPECDHRLEFKQSRIGGVTRNNPERWDEFECPECHRAFEYRHRVRKLKAIG